MAETAGFGQESPKGTKGECLKVHICIRELQISPLHSGVHGNLIHFPLKIKFMGSAGLVVTI